MDTSIRNTYISHNRQMSDIYLDIVISNIILEDSMGKRIVATQSIFAKQGNSAQQLHNIIKNNLFNDAMTIIHKYLLSHPEKYYLVRTSHSSNVRHLNGIATPSNAAYFNVYAKLPCGFLANTIGISLRMADHPDTNTATRSELDNASFSGEFDKTDPKLIYYANDIPPKNPEEFKLVNFDVEFNVTSFGTSPSIKFYSKDTAPLSKTKFNGISDFENSQIYGEWLLKCWEDSINNSTLLYYRGLQVIKDADGYFCKFDDNNISDTYDNPEFLAEYIDSILGDKSSEEKSIYGSSYYNSSAQDPLNIYGIGEAISDKLNSWGNGTVWFSCADAFFEDDYTTLSVQILDSHGGITTGVVDVDIDRLSDISYRSETVDLLFENMLQEYVATDYFDWED